MRKLILCMFLLLSLSSFSQSYKKNFLMNITEEGILHYVYGLEMKSLCDGVEALEYDYTCVGSRDYVTLAATCISENVVNIDSLYVLMPSGTTFACGVEKIFTELKSKWQTRFRVTVDYDFWLEMYGADAPFKIMLVCKDKSQIVYEDSRKNWMKIWKMMTKIQSVVKVNRD